MTALFLIAINFKQPLGDDSNSYNFVFTAWAFSNTIALLVVVHTTCALCDEVGEIGFIDDLMGINFVLGQ